MPRTLRNLSMFAITLTVIFFTLLANAYGVTVEPIPEFVKEAPKVITGDNMPALPDTLNDIPLEKLKGYKEISETLDKGRGFKTRIIACLLVYDDIRKKLEQSYDYMKNATGEVNPDNAFGGKFVPLSEEALIEKCPYPLTDGEKKAVLESMDELLRILKLKDFETAIVEDKTVDIKRASIFYSNAVKKTENRLQTTLKDLDEFSKTAAEEIQKFIRQNVRVEIMIGDNVNTSGVKKNFAKNSSIIIGLKYWSEKVEGDIPLEWTIKSPDKRFKMGKMTISGNKNGEYVKIVEGKIPEEALGGTYDVIVKLFPGEGDYESGESYNIEGVFAQITNTFILGKDKKTPKVLKNGDVVYLVIRYKPLLAGDQKATFTWNVFDPTGEKVPSLTLSKELGLRTTDKDIQTKYIKGVIPEDAKSGLHKFQAVVKVGSDKISSDIAEFLVASQLTVKIIPSKTKFKVGEKAVFRSRVVGGSAPYAMEWLFDSGEMSSNKDVAIIFSRPGKRWVTLTVRDSSTPATLQKTVKREVVVE